MLSRDLPLAPILVGGAALPAAADLPEDLRPLVRRQAIEVRDETWHQDVDNLLRSLRGEPAAPSRPSRRRLALAIGTAVLAAVAAVAWWRPWAGGPGDDGESPSAVLASCPDPGGQGWTTIPPTQSPAAVAGFDDGPLAFTVRGASWRPLEPGRWQVVVDTTMANRSLEDVYHADYRYGTIIVGEREFEQSCFEESRELLSPDTVGDGRTGYVVECEPAGRMELLLGDGDTRVPVTDSAEPSSC